MEYLERKTAQHSHSHRFTHFWLLHPSNHGSATIFLVEGWLKPSSTDGTPSNGWASNLLNRGTVSTQSDSEDVHFTAGALQARLAVPRRRCRADRATWLIGKGKDWGRLEADQVECTMMGGQYPIVYCNSACQVRFMNLLHPPNIAIKCYNFGGHSWQLKPRKPHRSTTPRGFSESVPQNPMVPKKWFR